MQRACVLPQKISVRAFPKYVLHQVSGKRRKLTTGQQASTKLSPRNHGMLIYPKQQNVRITCNDCSDERFPEHTIDISEESNLLGYVVYSGKLVVDRRTRTTVTQTEIGSSSQVGDDAQLTSKALIWGSHMLLLRDVVSVSYTAGMRHFTVHSYLSIRRWSVFSCIPRLQRSRKDFCFLAPTLEEATMWVTAFSNQHCFVHYLSHPAKLGDDAVTDPFFAKYIKSKTSPKVLVILNPLSGHGHSSKVFHDKVEPIFQLACFEMKVVKTEHAGHAKNIASTIDLSTCPDGIICIGGDGIVNEVLNGLLSRIDQKEALSVPIGVIPAGSDNSLVWTVLGVKDPVTAAITIVKGGFTPMDVLLVQWIQTGDVHVGNTAAYFGFVSDVLELSEKYQKIFGPFRYFLAGFLKFLCLPKYTFEVEYLPISEESNNEGIVLGNKEKDHGSTPVYTDVLDSLRDGVPRASNFSGIDSMMTSSRISGDLETNGDKPANCEPSEYVRGLDPKSKHLLLGRNYEIAEQDEVLHPKKSLSATGNQPRTRSISRTDKSCAGPTSTNDTHFSLGPAMRNKDVFSTASDPGPIWEPEPRFCCETLWNGEHNWKEHSAELPVSLEHPIEPPDPSDNAQLCPLEEAYPKHEEKWVAKKDFFLGILICNHSCRSVQSSQVVAPKAKHNDRSLDLILVHGSGRFKLARFFVHLQFGSHLLLPYVEYIKVKSVKVRPGKICHNGCGIDGELLNVNSQVVCSLLPDQCQLLGRPTEGHYGL